jgi:hypothetical protein
MFYNDGIIDHYKYIITYGIMLYINSFHNYFSTSFAGFFLFSFLCNRFKKNSAKTKKR